MFDIGTGSLLSNDELVSGKIPRISAKSDNNGVLGYFSTEGNDCARHFNNFISVNFFGSDGGIFYHPYTASVEMKVHTLKMKNHIFNRSTALFIASKLKSVLGGFSYGNQLSSSKLKNLNFQISLPITEEGEIDFPFMESFIKALEAERIKKLEDYLISTGLSHYQLTPKEEKVLDIFTKNMQRGGVETPTVLWREFSFQQMFKYIQQGRRLKKEDQISGDIPFVMAGTTNTGVVNYVSNPVAQFPKNAITMDIFGNAFYRSYAFGAGDDTGVYWNPLENEYSREIMLFLTTAMSKSVFKKFSYGKKLRSSQSLKIKMKLPATPDGQPDFDTMQTLISAVQKQVIKDVVKYTEQKMAESH